MERRFGEAARIDYLDVSQESVKAEHASVVDDIETRGLLYPVTAIDGVPVYDGAVSYPAILRAVQKKLETTAERA
jgi:disulfide oxidoreductase YuzD